MKLDKEIETINDIALDMNLYAKDNFGEKESEKIIKEKIARLEYVMLQMPQVEPPLNHIFTTGVYAREMFIPKGTVIIGKIHRHAHLNFISVGDVTVLTKDGLQRITGPWTMVSTEGTKRALYAHEDTVWTTIHSNHDEDRDLDMLEEKLIAKSYDDLKLGYIKPILFEVMP